MLWKHTDKKEVQPDKVNYARLRWSSSPILPAPRSTGTPRPPRQRNASRHRLGVAPRYGASMHPHGACRRNRMKTFLSLLLVAVLFCAVSPASYADPHQLLQGMQVHLTLLNSISTAASRDGDPFGAVVAEPVYLGNQLLVPAGTPVNGVIGTVEKARHFSIFRGQAYMNLTFRSIEIDSRLIPVQMSIITIEQPRGQAEGKRRKYVKIEEGQVVQEKHDVKGDIAGAAIGTGGGTLVGAVFSHVARGFGFGLAGSAAYIVAPKGKDLDLPAQTGMLVRMDNTITVPVTSASNASLTTSSR